MNSDMERSTSKRYSSFFLPHQAVASNTVTYLDKRKPQAVYIWAIYGCLSIFFVKLHQAKPAKTLAQCVFISASLHIQPTPQHGSLYRLTFICLLLSILRQKKTAIAPMSNYGFVLVLYLIPVLLSLAEGALTPFLSPFLPNLLRPNLLRPEIQPHSTIPPPACIVGVFP